MLSFIDIKYKNITNSNLNKLFLLRKKIFKDRLSWAVTCQQEMEFDEYDNNNTTYILGMYQNCILCSVRFIEMKHQNMIEGVFYKYFKTISIPIGNYIEATRLFVDKEKLSALKLNHPNYQISNMLFMAMISYAKKMHYDGIYAIISHPMLVIFKRAGWNIETIKEGISEKNQNIYLVFMPLDYARTHILMGKFAKISFNWPLSFTIDKKVA